MYLNSEIFCARPCSLMSKSAAVRSLMGWFLPSVTTTSDGDGVDAAAEDWPWWGLDRARSRDRDDRSRRDHSENDQGTADRQRAPPGSDRGKYYDPDLMKRAAFVGLGLVVAGAAVWGLVTYGPYLRW